MIKETRWMTPSEKAEVQQQLREKAAKVALAIYTRTAKPSYIIDDILDYWDRRGLVWPTTLQAIQWATTEAGEVAEQLLAKDSDDWVRNNPEDHAGYSEERLMEELADEIFMLLVAGMVSGYDLLSVMRNKMERKLKEHDV